MNGTINPTTIYQIPHRHATRPAWIDRQALHRIKMLSEGFEPINLKEMDNVALLNRIDVKYVMTIRQLEVALARLQQDYWILDVNGVRLNRYRTLYFDTSRFELYHAHVNKRCERYKVRSREYADSHISFLEIKRRTRKQRTIKERIITDHPAMQLTPALENWLRLVSAQSNIPLNGNQLEPKLRNTFTRITLVSKQCCERVTLDFDLTFSSDEKRIQLGGIVIAEVKLEASHQSSDFMAQMRSQKVRSQSFSKYAYGVAMLYDQVKKNAMKPKMLRIERIRRSLSVDHT